MDYRGLWEGGHHYGGWSLYLIIRGKSEYHILIELCCRGLGCCVGDRGRPTVGHDASSFCVLFEALLVNRCA